MSLIYIIEDEPIAAECIAMAVGDMPEAAPVSEGVESPIDIAIYNDAVSAISDIDQLTPDVILLDVMLSGPDGFAFLNEMVSYHDISHIPIALITTLSLQAQDFSHYGVFRVLDKATMTPEDIQATVREGLALRSEYLSELGSQSAMSQSPEMVAPVVDGSQDVDLSPEAEAVINGNASDLMDVVLGMPSTSSEANVEPVVLSDTSELENPAEPMDFLEIPHGDPDVD